MTAAAELAPVLQIVLAVAALKFLDLAVGKFWKKAVDTDYVTSASCASCRAECKAGRTTSQEDLIKIVRVLREEVKALRMAIVRNMLHGGAPASAIEDVLEGKIGGSN